MEYIYKERQNEYEPSISGEKYTDNVGQKQYSIIAYLGLNQPGCLDQIPALLLFSWVVRPISASLHPKYPPFVKQES